MAKKLLVKVKDLKELIRGLPDEDWIDLACIKAAPRKTQVK